MRTERESNIVATFFVVAVLVVAWRFGYNAGRSSVPVAPVAPVVAPVAPAAVHSDKDCKLYEDGSMRCDTRDFGIFSGCVVGEWGCQDGGTPLGLAPTEDAPPGLTQKQLNEWQVAMTACMADKSPIPESLTELQSGCADAVAEGPLGDP